MYPREIGYAWSNAEWNFENDIGPCSYDHAGKTCIQSTFSFGEGVFAWGVAKLKVKIDLSRINGDEKRVSLVYCKGMVTKSWWIGPYWGLIKIYADGRKIWEKPINYGDGVWVENKWVEPDIPMLDEYKELDVEIEHRSRPYAGSIEMHTANIQLKISYDAVEPPKKYKVTFECLDSATANPIAMANVRLMRDNIVKYSGITGLDGTVTFTEVEEGSYTLYVEHPDYYPYSYTITVKGDSAYMIKMDRKPSILDQIRDWLIRNYQLVLLTGGIAAVGYALWIYGPTIKKELEKRIIGV